MCCQNTCNLTAQRLQILSVDSTIFTLSWHTFLTAAARLMRYVLHISGAVVMWELRTWLARLFIFMFTFPFASSVTLNTSMGQRLDLCSSSIKYGTSLLVDPSSAWGRVVAYSTEEILFRTPSLVHGTCLMTNHSRFNKNCTAFGFRTRTITDQMTPTSLYQPLWNPSSISTDY